MFRSSKAHTALPAAEIDAAISEELGPRLIPRGFEQVKRRSWVRSTAAPIRHEVGVGALKGYSFAPGWSISLDFVPHVTSTGRIGWHRNGEAAPGDLSIDPLDYPDVYDMDALALAGMRSPRAFRRALGRSAELTVRYAEDWLEPLTSLAAVIAAFERAEAHQSPRFGFDNYVQHRLAFAFVLARAGQVERAAAELDRWCDLHSEDHLRSELHRLLVATAGS